MKINVLKSLWQIKKNGVLIFVSRLKGQDSLKKKSWNNCCNQVLKHELKINNKDAETINEHVPFKEICN